ncbi:hypothetical protein QPL79_02870 [Ignisphaera sp. 4213-co]|uniref:Uncharacterized protein n=1 Tax=Ignisphaera cupida TaxID=3050454 RepID=A0ABD4Z5W8_9CREN|nr:hypothetical protein [Ignisphaera sp. 4213-co]MDK6028305.1 hypothetical protein [Ignisphaera sp. 4213-co]
MLELGGFGSGPGLRPVAPTPLGAWVIDLSLPWRHRLDHMHLVFLLSIARD